MKSEWRVRAVYELLEKPAYQVYRLKDMKKGDIRENREVLSNYSVEDDARAVAANKNRYDIEHFWEH